MSYSDTDLQITSPLEIVSILRSLHDRNTLIHLHVPGRQLAIITTVLQIDSDAEILVIDNASEDELNARLLSAESLSMEAQLDKIRILFTVRSVRACMHEGKPALAVPFPEGITRIQRREYYRIDIPLTEPANCTLQLPTHPFTLKLSIQDISGGGLGLLDHDHVLENMLGSVFEYCTLRLPDQPDVKLSLKIVRAVSEKLANEKMALRVGCEFVNISNAASMQVHRYVSQLERKAIARQRGLD